MNVGSSDFRVGKKYCTHGHRSVEKTPKISHFLSLEPDQGRDRRNEKRWPSSDAPDCGNHKSFFNCLNL